MTGFRQIKNYFHFNRGERRGLVILFIILVLVIAGDLIIPLFIPDKQYDMTNFLESVKKFEAAQVKIKDSIESLNIIRTKRTELKSKLTPFLFDPNDLPKNEWLKMGLSEKQVDVIKNYISKGGRFHVPEDLSKIYSLSEKDFTTLLPFIRIKKDQTTAIHLNPVDSLSGDSLIINIDSVKVNHFIPIQSIQIADSIFPLDINSSDTLDLQLLPGIGPSFSSRIVKYRNLLGGYVHLGQLLEVFGMDSIRYKGFESYISIDTSSIQKLNINLLGIKALNKHPYIDYYLAKTIVTERTKGGKFMSLTNFKSRVFLPEKRFIQLYPYLHF